MKKLRNLKQYAFAILCVLTIISCEKEDSFETTNLNTEEIDSEVIEAKVVLSKTYDANLSREEIKIQFAKEVETYLSSQKNSENKASQNFNYSIFTNTPNKRNASSSNPATAIVTFDNLNIAVSSNLGIHIPGPKMTLVNVALSPGQTVTELKVKSIDISKPGSDKWEIDYIDVLVQGYQQEQEATGTSVIFSFPNNLVLDGTNTYKSINDSGATKSGVVIFE